MELDAHRVDEIPADDGPVDARDGQTWSIERLLRAELNQDLDRSACGGTHRMMGIAMALKRHREAQGAITGVWQEADQRVQQALEATRQMQNPNGSFSVHYFERPGQSPDVTIDLGATGHILEFVTIALPPERLHEPWVVRAANYLCELLQQTQGIALECGTLYHAAHGLILYREHVFGPRTYEAVRVPQASSSGSDRRTQLATHSPSNQTRPIALVAPPYRVQLGAPELTAGIPGSGALTLQQIQDWLSDPQNHRVIEPVLPTGSVRRPGQYPRRGGQPADESQD